MSEDNKFHVEQVPTEATRNIDLDACPICDNQTFRKKLSVVDHFYSRETFQISECTQCGFNCTNPKPADRFLASYYNSEKYVSHSGSRKGIFNRIYHSVQTLNFIIKLKSIPRDVPHGTWADYGAGKGGFVKYIQQQGKTIVGFEPDETARLNAHSSGIELKSTNQYLNDNQKYACITMWHVLEHIPNPNEILAKHWGKLLPGGIMAIAVPNYESFDAKWYEEYWAAFDVPRHLWHFSEKHIIKLCARNNFDFIYSKSMPFDAFYVSMLSEGYQKKLKLKGVVIGALSNFYAKFSDYPYSSQIYIFKKRI